MRSLENKIHEEKERLQLLKESGEVEEFVTPRRSPAKRYILTGQVCLIWSLWKLRKLKLILIPVRSEIDLHDEDREEGAAEIDYSSDDDEDPFSDRNRWRRGGIVDPDANEW